MKTYSTPTLVSHGALVDLTGDFGVSGIDDLYILPNGNDDETRQNTGSIDGCVQEAAPGGGLKCVCTDQGTCID